METIKTRLSLSVSSTVKVRNVANYHMRQSKLLLYNYSYTNQSVYIFKLTLKDYSCTTQEHTNLHIHIHTTRKSLPGDFQKYANQPILDGAIVIPTIAFMNARKSLFS